MQMATPGHESSAVASLVGVTPAPVDPGQPIRLALRKTDTQMAETAPVSTPAPVPAPAPEAQTQVATVAPPPAAELAPAPATVQVAQAAPAPQLLPFIDVPHKAAKAAPSRDAKAPVKAANLRRPNAAKPAPVRVATTARGKGKAVVQLGAYSNSKSVLAAWNVAAHRYRALQAYAPSSPRGTVYRLSVEGFASVNEAMALCSSVRHSGGSCFVRNLAGDTPVEIASRS
jgi:hypothetical protein